MINTAARVKMTAMVMALNIAQAGRTAAGDYRAEDSDTHRVGCLPKRILFYANGRLK
jgi:hypothetical protein